MSQTPDPFTHHPELRDRITSSENSFFRHLNVDDLLRQYPELEPFRSWMHSDETREAIRAQAMARHTGDLWVFAYGSLMWDPALRFQEVRRVHAAGYARRLILKDDKGGRGTQEAPGLMAALDAGPHCEGLAFRISEQDVAAETEILFRRELIGPGYVPKFIPVTSGETVIQAITFLADHDSPDMLPDIDRSEQVHLIATGAGILGTSHDYLFKIVQQLAHLGIEDPDCAALLQDVEDYRSRNQIEVAAP